MKSVPHVTSAQVLEGFRLRLTFEDATSGDIDLVDELWGPLFEPLHDRAFFAQVAVDMDGGTIVWPNGADFAPEWLYEVVRAQHASTQTGGIKAKRT
jgi:Protein of unknown function (DUF2442)